MLIWRSFREYLQTKNFLENPGSVAFLPLQSHNFTQKIRKNLRAVSEKTALPTNPNEPTNQPMLIWRSFREYLQTKNFLENPGSVAFLPLQFHNFMQKIRNILRAVSEKTALPANQPKNQSINLR